MKQVHLETEPLDDDWIYGRTAINRGISWVVPSAFSFLEASFKPDWKVFEWGAGGSTVWFAQNCSEVVTIEVDPNWKERMEKILTEKGLEDKATIIHVPIEEYKSDYYDKVLMFPDGYFDLIYVDGDRASRNACTDAALRKIKPGGWLLVDNTNWSSETPSFLNIAHWDSFEFEALPFKWFDVPSEWKTTFFRKPTFDLSYTEWLRFLLPELFTNPGTLLYVGASQNRQECLSELIEAGNQVTILEIWPDNVEYLREKDLTVIEADVRNVPLEPMSFDYVFWWHGPEHIRKSELGNTAHGLERLGRRMVVMACPWGRNRQGEFGGNPYERHLSPLYDRDFQKLGYEIAHLGAKNYSPHSAIIAWKRME